MIIYFWELLEIMAQIIAIHSYKGGSGKSLVASALAYYCAQIRKEKTIIFDCDFEAPSLNTLLPPEKEPEGTILDLFRGTKNFEHIIASNPQISLLDVIYAPNPSRAKEILSMNEESHARILQYLIAAVNRLTEEMQYRWIIFDNQSGLSMNAINFLMLSTSSLIILRPAQYAVQGMLDVTKYIYTKVRPFLSNKSRIDLLLWNQLPGGTKIAQIQNLIQDYNQQFQKLGITPIGEINYENDIAAELFLQKTVNIQNITTFMKPSIQRVVEVILSAEE